MLGSLAIHMILPALPQVAVALHTDASGARMILTAYLVALACGQLASGPLADRWGRERMIVAGGMVFAVASFGCWAAHDIATLIAARVVQALGASAGLVAGRAIAGDVGGDHGRRMLALLSATGLFSPMLAPVIGGLLAASIGWRSIFAVLAATGFGLVIAALATVRAPAHSPGRIVGAHPLRAWSDALASPGFRRNLVCGSAMSAGLYVFLAEAPFLLASFYHVPASASGLVFGAIALGAGAGALGAGAIASRYAAGTVIRAALLAGVVAALALGVLTQAGLHHPTALVGPMAGFALSGGLVMPNAMAAAMRGLDGRVGTAISLYGALQMAGSGIATAVAALLPAHDPRLVAGMLVILSLTGFASAVRSGD